MTVSRNYVYFVGNLIIPSRTYFIPCSNHLYLFNFITFRSFSFRPILITFLHYSKINEVFFNNVRTFHEKYLTKIN